MEQKLGIALLTRDRRGVWVTPAGQCLLDHARLVILQVDRMRGELGGFSRGLTGSVRVLSNTAAFSEHLPKALASFLTGNPTINIDLEERESTDIGEAIASGAADIGIAAEAALPDAVEKFPFRTDRLVLVTSHGDALAKRRQVNFGELIDRDFVGLSRESGLQRHIAGHVARLGTTIKLRVRVNGFDAVCRMVEAGVGIGVIPEVAARRCRRSMPLNLAHIRDDWAIRRLAICCDKHRPFQPPQKNWSSI
jgi:DNA-binding transcriptional LysR family regulator